MSTWLDSYLASKKDADEELIYGLFNRPAITVGSIIEALKKTDAKFDEEQARQPKHVHPLPYFDIFWPRDPGCPNCKHFAVRHGYGDSTCTYGCWSTIFSAARHCCLNYERDEKPYHKEAYWITHSVWHMMYERLLPSSLPSKDLRELYLLWRDEGKGMLYYEEYVKRKKEQVHKQRVDFSTA